MDREPVKRAEKWSDMVEFRRTVNKSGSVVLDFLKFRQKIDRRARKKSVTIVETRQNKSTEKGFGSIFRQEVADGSYSVFVFQNNRFYRHWLRVDGRRETGRG